MKKMKDKSILAASVVFYLINDKPPINSKNVELIRDKIFVGVTNVYVMAAIRSR